MACIFGVIFNNPSVKQSFLGLFLTSYRPKNSTTEAGGNPPASVVLFFDPKKNGTLDPPQILEPLKIRPIFWGSVKLVIFTKF